MDRRRYTTEDFICDQSFQQYCLGADKTDIAHWENWIYNNPDRKPETEEAKRIIALLTANQGKLDENLGQLKDGIYRYELLKTAIVKSDSAAPAKQAKIHFMQYAAIAASVLVVLAGVWYIAGTGKQAASPLSAISHNAVTLSGDGPRKTIVLPDGSLVTLRNKSILTLQANFNSDNRNLTLTGEAFFDVAPKAVPFIVHTTDLDIEVLGTVFNVSAYPRSFTEASLFRGKVAVSVNGEPGKRIMLSPNQKFVFHHKKELRKTSPDSTFSVLPLAMDPVDYKAKEIAWVRSRLKIEDESFETIAARLETWYGISIVFGDSSVKAYRYSGTFENETVIKVLEALQLSYPFNFHAENNTITITR